MFLWHILIWTDLSSIKFFIPQINTFIMISVEMLTAIPFAKWTCFTYYFNLPCKQRGNVEACEVSFSSFPFPLAGGGQSGVFDGFYPAVTFSSSLIHVLQKNTVACVSCVFSALLCAHSSWPRRWCDGWWQGLRRQSMSSAWNTGGQWGSLPVLARTLHLEWPWSSHLGLSERCHCQYREIWSLYLGKAEKIWGSQTLSSFTSFTAEVWKAMPRSVFWRGLLQNDLKLCSLKGAAKQADTQPDMLNHRTNEQQTRTNSL